VVEELAKFERADVQMQENRKHLQNKQKRVKKEYQKVSRNITLGSLQSPTGILDIRLNMQNQKHKLG
jgi:hypothetical protein